MGSRFKSVFKEKGKKVLYLKSNFSSIKENYNAYDIDILVLEDFELVGFSKYILNFQNIKTVAIRFIRKKPDTELITYIMRNLVKVIDPEKLILVLDRSFLKSLSIDGDIFNIFPKIKTLKVTGFLIDLRRLPNYLEYLKIEYSDVNIQNIRDFYYNSKNLKKLHLDNLHNINSSNFLTVNQGYIGKVSKLEELKLSNFNNDDFKVFELDSNNFNFKNLTIKNCRFKSIINKNIQNGHISNLKIESSRIGKILINNIMIDSLIMKDVILNSILENIDIKNVKELNIKELDGDRALKLFDLKEKSYTISLFINPSGLKSLIILDNRIYDIITNPNFTNVFNSLEELNIKSLFDNKNFLSSNDIPINSILKKLSIKVDNNFKVEYIKNFTSLKSIKLKYSQYQDVDMSSFLLFNDLEEIYLKSVNINFKNTSSSFDKIKSLSLIECELENLDFLYYFPNVINLNLKGNQIENVDKLENNRKIETLDLSCNNIKSFDINFFLSLTNLKDYNIDNNYIEHLDFFLPTIIKENKSTISLKGNSLSDLDCKFIFDKYQTIINIDLSNNKRLTFPDNIKSLKECPILNFRGNQLIEIIGKDVNNIDDIICERHKGNIHYISILTKILSLDYIPSKKDIRRYISNEIYRNVGEKMRLFFSLNSEYKAALASLEPKNDFFSYYTIRSIYSLYEIFGFGVIIYLLNYNNIKVPEEFYHSNIHMKELYENYLVKNPKYGMMIKR